MAFTAEPDGFAEGDGADDDGALTEDEGAGEAAGDAGADGEADGFSLPAGVFCGAVDGALFGALVGASEGLAAGAWDWTGLPEFDTLELPAHPASIPESSRTADAAAVFFMESP
ncbi:hypothetical protein [Paenibacillus sp. 1P03SA]|uniref:hypothetical protein n=1 Tax=Paenibacillus sp. 1P03SA TaxID=3132294 RepID=UPI0039A2D66A